MGLQASSREVDIHDILAHELAPVPTSMFSDSGDMRIAKGKSQLKRLLQKQTSVRHTAKSISCTIIDGSTILYVVHWPVNGTVADFVVNMKSYIQRKLACGDVYMIVDRYRDFSTKSCTRSGRGSSASRVHKLGPNMQLPPKNIVLAVPANKKQLIAAIVDAIIQDLHFHQNYTENPQISHHRGKRHTSRNT